jgi:uncharacterized protein DUF4835
MKTILAAVALLVLLALPGKAQEIDLTLEVTMDALSPSVRDYLEEFSTQVEKYVEDHRWTNIEFHGDRIPVNMQINFTSGSEAGDFTAQIVVVSQRRMFNNGRPTQNSTLIFRALDPAWSFAYNKGIPMVHDEYQFNEIASVLDFYIYFVIGLDFDSMELLQGTPYYQKALLAAQRSQSSQRQSEWRGSINQYSRMNLISEIMNAKYVNFRNALYWYYYEGLDFLATEPKPAKNSIAKALQFVAGVVSESTAQSIILTMWLESLSSSFCMNLEGYTDRKQLMTLLAQVDPQRADTYQQCGF